MRSIVRLSPLIESDGGAEAEEFLRTFRCSRDSDLETFLHERAIFYEKKGKTRTYLLVSSSTPLAFKSDKRR